MIYATAIVALAFPTAAVAIIVLAIVLKNDLPRPGVIITAQGYRTRPNAVDTSLTVDDDTAKKKGNQLCN